jgi:hypothetical protein
MSIRFAGVDYMGYTLKLYYADSLCGMTFLHLVIWFSTSLERRHGWNYWCGDIIASVFPYNKGEKCAGIICDTPS